MKQAETRFDLLKMPSIKAFNCTSVNHELYSGRRSNVGAFNIVFGGLNVTPQLISGIATDLPRRTPSYQRDCFYLYRDVKDLFALGESAPI